MGDKLSVFSDKAYRKNNGRYFEAVGNVVIISGKDTVYGELATLNQDTQMVKLEGNVRLITKDLTLYGSHIDYNIATGQANVKNARILTSQFNLVANELIRVSENEYIAVEAEFSTCRDCTESWSIYGKKIRLLMGEYVQISHGLMRVKGMNVLYIPYIVFPILNERKSGLLFPIISSRLNEGMYFQQPVFWAISQNKDATVTPTYWAKRGYGSDLEYRHRFTDKNWLEFDVRGVNDTIYQPYEKNSGPSGEEFFRYFVEAESHQQWTPNFSTHERYTGTRDLDFLRDYPTFTDDKILSSDIGFTGSLNYRQEMFSFTGQAQYLRNQMFVDPMEFDRAYVQTMPRLTLSTTPYSLVQSSVPMFQHIYLGFDGAFNRFAQVDKTENVFLRNANRFSYRPYINWHFMTLGPVALKSHYQFDQQSYQFEDHKQAHFGKNAGLLKTEISFTMDKIFGLAYEEKIPLKYLSEKEMKKIRDRKDEKIVIPIQKNEKESRLVGRLQEFESELAQDSFIQKRNSYRHSQEYKFIHHYIPSQNEYGNRRFGRQIETFDGWFDYEDAIRSREQQQGSTVTRTLIPPANTIEFQWNNSIIKKISSTFNFLDDDKYLRDNFSYGRMGYFNVSQGYQLDDSENKELNEDYRRRLTRLQISAGYIMDKWSIEFAENYFHYEQKNIFNVSGARHFDYFTIYSTYNYNSFQGPKLNTISAGWQIRPTETLSFAMAKDMDLSAKKNMRTIYSLYIMPYNNCWVLNLGYQERLMNSQYFFNFMLNFGDGTFEKKRNKALSTRL